jgi:hypothetical protein
VSLVPVVQVSVEAKQTTGIYDVILLTNGSNLTIFTCVSFQNNTTNCSKVFSFSPSLSRAESVCFFVNSNSSRATTANEPAMIYPAYEVHIGDVYVLCFHCLSVFFLPYFGT